MVLGVSIYKDETPETASIVPIAFPLIADDQLVNKEKNVLVLPNLDLQRLP